MHNLDQTKVAIMESTHSRNKSDSGEAVILLIKLSNNLVLVFSNFFDTPKTTDHFPPCVIYTGKPIVLKKDNID